MLLAILFMVCYEGVLAHVITYQEQHHLFLFSYEYFQRTLLSGGWTEYLGSFFVQFFYYHALGSALLSLMIASIYLMLYKSFYWITGRLDLLQLSLIPSAYFFLKSMAPDYSLGILVITWVVLLFVTLVCRLVSTITRRWFAKCPEWKVKPLIYWLITAACISVYGFISFSKFVTNYNMGEYRMIMADKAVKERKWDEVLDQTERYLRSGRMNQLMFYYRNMAWYHKGELLNHLLDYPHRFGVKSLYFPWNSDSRESEYGYAVYEQLGYINEANRWEFEAMVVWGESAPHLIRLAQYNILINRPKVAQRFINVLKKSGFYRGIAKELEENLREGKVPGLRLALSNEVKGKPRFANIINLGPELHYLCQQDDSNNMAFEYLLADLLLSNQVVRLMKALNTFPNYTKRIGKFPFILEEALYIYKIGVGDEKFEEFGLSISPRTEQRFSRYYSLYQQNDVNALRAEFGHSYWYYLHFLSPYGTKIITE